MADHLTFEWKLELIALLKIAHGAAGQGYTAGKSRAHSSMVSSTVPIARDEAKHMTI
jgi:hypothetical protein